MRKITAFFITTILTSSFIWVYAESINPKGKVKVMAVNGTVLFKGKPLTKYDTIEFVANTSAVSQLKFFSATDWVKVMEISTKNLYTFFRQKRYGCIGCLGTKGGGTYINNDLDLLKYFGRNSIFLFGPDTLICHGTSVKSDTITVPVFQFTINGVLHNKVVGRNDTIFISNDLLFDDNFSTTNSMTSFWIDSIRLIYYKQSDPQKQIIPELPYFHIYFFEDAVRFMHSIGLNEDGIYTELIENYLDLSNISNIEKLGSLVEAEKWLRKKILFSLY